MITFQSMGQVFCDQITSSNVNFQFGSPFQLQFILFDFSRTLCDITGVISVNKETRLCTLNFQQRQYSVAGWEIISAC